MSHGEQEIDSIDIDAISDNEADGNFELRNGNHHKSSRVTRTRACKVTDDNQLENERRAPRLRQKPTTNGDSNTPN
jgi:hypothetical protein